MTDPLQFLDQQQAQSSPDDPLSFLGGGSHTDTLNFLGEPSAPRYQPPQSTYGDQTRSIARRAFDVAEGVGSFIYRLVDETVNDMVQYTKLATLRNAGPAVTSPSSPGYGVEANYGIPQVMDKAAFAALPPTRRAQAAPAMTDPLGQIQTPDYQETYGEYIARRAAEGDPEADAQFKAAIRGGAFAASMGVSSAARAVLGWASPAARVALGKGGALLASEALAGAAYGGMRPLEEGESRLDAVTQDAGSFALTAWGLHVSGEALTRVFKTIPRAKRIAVIRAAREKLDQTVADIAEAGENAGNLSPIEKQALQTRAIADAMEEAGYQEPAMREIENITVHDPGTPTEPAPRLRNVFDDLLAGMEPREIEAHGLPPEMNIEYTPEFKAPAQVEPTGLEGVVKGPGLPERAPEPPKYTLQLRERGPEIGGDGQTEILRYDVITDKGQNYGTMEVFHDQGAQHATVNWLGPSPTGTRNAEGVLIDKLDLGHATLRQFAGQLQKDMPEVTRLNAEHITGSRIGSAAADRSPKMMSIDLRNVKQKLADEIKDNHAGLEPQMVTPGMPRPRGFAYTVLPTITGVRKLGGGVEQIIYDENTMVKGAQSVVEQLAIAHEAVKDVVSRIEPMDVAVPEVQAQSAALREALHDIEPSPVPLKPSKTVSKELTKALSRESPMAEQGLMIEGYSPTPSDLNLETPLKALEGAKEKRSTLSELLSREQAPIEMVSPQEMVNASWIEAVADNATNVAPKASGWSIAARMTDQQLKEFEGIANRRGGFTYNWVLSRLVMGGAGSTLWVAGNRDDISPGERAALKVLGGFMIVAAGAPLLKKWALETKFSRRLIQMYAHEATLTGGAKDVARAYRELFTSGRTFAVTKSRYLEDVFKTPAEKKNALFVVHEGPAAPEFALLTPPQQQEAQALNQFDLWMAQALKAEGALDTYTRKYVRNILPEATYQRWLQMYNKGQAPLGIRELERWAKSANLEGPDFDVAKVQGRQIEAAYQTLGVARVKKTMQRLGLVYQPPLGAALPTGVRNIRVNGMQGFVAPDDVAAAMENIAGSSAPNELLQAADKIKSAWMRGIMFWWWEHGINVMRSVPGIDLNPVTAGMGYFRSMKAIKNADPVMYEASSHGLDLFSRPDYVSRTAANFNTALSKLGAAMPTLKYLQERGAQMVERSDRLLWERYVPALGLFAYTTELRKWAERTGHQFLPGTPEYVAAARKAADYANTLMGRVPSTMQDPRLGQALRLAMFSPSWTMSRISITAHAAGELGDYVAGQKPAGDLLYLPYKMRQLAAATAVVWAGSMLLTGKEPTFNPNTNKYYMRTGLRDINGREVGLDLAGWWQDDLKAFNVPDKFLADRLNPSLNAVGEAVNGRDHLGRSLSGMERIDNLIRGFGPIPAALEAGARAVNNQPPMLPAEGLQRASDVLAMFNVATLPRPLDATITETARRLLSKAGVPANDDNVFELTRLMRSNLRTNGAMIDNRVIDYMAYRRRLNEQRKGLASYLWQWGRSVLNNLSGGQ